MKSLFLSALLSFLSVSTFAQQKDPVTWSAEYISSDDKNQGEIRITGAIQDGWHTYSQRPTDDGPIPTSFSFTPLKDYTLKGNTQENGAKEEFVPAFGAKIYVFHHKAEFSQKIALNKNTSFSIPLQIEYMSCNDMMCLPPKTVTLQVQVRK